MRLLILILLVGMISGCNSKKETTESKTVSEIPSASSTKTETGTENSKELKLTAEALTSAFERDSNAAIKSYVRKNVDVTGTFDDFIANNWGREPEICLILRGTSKKPNDKY